MGKPLKINKVIALSCLTFIKNKDVFRYGYSNSIAFLVFYLAGVVCCFLSTKYCLLLRLQYSICMQVFHVKILDNRKIRREVFLGKVPFDSISLPYI